jgi:TonB family protein
VGSGDRTFGAGATRLHGLVTKRPTVRGLPAEIQGSLSREVIQRAIRLHMAEFRYCYEQSLAAHPDLQGRVSTRFVISPSGTVQLAGIASSDLGNAAVSQCVLGVLRRLMFPAPSGGGMVDVTYPFVFQQTGG